MLKLIKRELIDQAGFSFIAFAGSLSFVLMMLYAVHDLTREMSVSFVRIGLILLSFIPAICHTFGMVQMQYDYKNRNLAFLVSLGTSRKQIFISKLLAGIIWIAFLAVPLLITIAVLSSYFYQMLEQAQLRFLFRYCIMSVLLMLSYHGIGLLVGLTKSRFIAAAAGVLLFVAYPFFLVQVSASESAILILLCLWAASVTCASIRFGKTAF